jgi:LPXTG-motif cell wall-anchored protein
VLTPPATTSTPASTTSTGVMGATGTQIMVGVAVLGAAGVGLALLLQPKRRGR